MLIIVKSAKDKFDSPAWECFAVFPSDCEPLAGVPLIFQLTKAFNHRTIIAAVRDLPGR
jgi:hypothetical protein